MDCSHECEAYQQAEQDFDAIEGSTTAALFTEVPIPEDAPTVNSATTRNASTTAAPTSPKPSTPS